MIAAQSTVAAPWEEVGTGSTASAVAGWQTPALVDDTWEDVSNPSSSATMRIKMWGYSPELSSPSENIWCEHTWPTITDENNTESYPIYVFTPSPGTGVSDVQQDKTYLGYWNGTEAKVRACFRRDKNQDDSTNITAEIMTDRLIPGAQTNNYKLFSKIGFTSTYQDPTQDSNATLKYLLDFDDPHIRSYASSLITITQTGIVKQLPRMLGKYMHLYMTDTSQSQSKILLGEFFIQYRERMR
jgi:hypothetical protein